ncbi:MAG: YciI family protein [Nibricoccus sp.]
MQYIMLIYLDAKRWSELSVDERNRVHRECGEWHDSLVKSGHSRHCAGLQPISTATTLREAGGKTVITDGPFAETKEFLGGFESVECKDLDEAIAIAKRFPGLRVGTAVEVRPHVPGNECKD